MRVGILIKIFGHLLKELVQPHLLKKNPLVKLLMDVSESQESILEDHLLLCNRINLHRCSDYCLRAPKNSPSSSFKQCRMEFGTSLNPGKPLRENPAIVRDRNGSLRLEMPRDHPSLN
jgi:hypothetical protein